MQNPLNPTSGPVRPTRRITNQSGAFGRRDLHMRMCGQLYGSDSARAGTIPGHCEVLVGVLPCSRILDPLTVLRHHLRPMSESSAFYLPLSRPTCAVTCHLDRRSAECSGTLMFAKLFDCWARVLLSRLQISTAVRLIVDRSVPSMRNCEVMLTC